MSYPDPIKPSDVAKVAAAVVVAIALVIFTIAGIVMLFKGIGRSQARADAENRVRVSEVEIRNQAQRVEIAKQQAEIRLQDAIGIRASQDEIAKTLTPLYVQFEMVDALRRIAESGKNNTVVFIPVGEAGIPVIQPLPEIAKSAAE